MQVLTDFISVYFTETLVAVSLIYLGFVSLSKHPETQNYILLIAGFVVLGLIDLQHLIVLLLICALTYIAGVYLSGFKSKTLLVVSLGLIIGILIYFRYFSAISYGLTSIFQGGNSDLAALVPLGISFYSLQSISYLVDVYTGRMPASTNLVHLSLYLSFIFKLPAGPIERPASFLEQIRGPRPITAEKINEGIYLILQGLYEKRVLADNLAPIVNQVFADPAENPGLNIVVAVLAFALQLYGDFAGYSHIARGLAKFFGFDLMVNFKLPYFATSPNDFWLRWHISLSTWLREYIFFPVRRWMVVHKWPPVLGVIVPTVVTMVVSGLWHGNGPTFLLWGLYFAALLIAYQYLDKRANVERSRWLSYTIVVFSHNLDVRHSVCGLAHFSS